MEWIARDTENILQMPKSTSRSTSRPPTFSMAPLYTALRRCTPIQKHRRIPTPNPSKGGLYACLPTPTGFPKSHVNRFTQRLAREQEQRMIHWATHLVTRK
jgi:hypothetical protein